MKNSLRAPLVARKQMIRAAHIHQKNHDPSAPPWTPPSDIQVTQSGSQRHVWPWAANESTTKAKIQLQGNVDFTILKINYQSYR